MSANALANTNITQYSVLQLIEYSFRECGLFAEAQTPQLVNAGRQALHYLLQEMSNKTELLYQWRYILIAPRQNQRAYTLPAGTIDIKNLNWRYSTNLIPSIALPSDNTSAPNAFDLTLTGNPATSTVNNNWLGLDLGVNASNRVTYVGINAFGNNSYSLILEWSNDGATWTSASTLSTVTLSDGEWMYWQVDATPSARFWRVRSSLTATFSVRQIVFGNSPSVIPLARLNKDEYWNLPNKDVNYGSRSLQYWFDRQASAPIINFWPIPQDDFQLFEALIEVEMADVGLLGDVIAIPNRWLNAVQSALSARIALQLPNIQPDRIQLLQSLAQQAYAFASGEERDRSPFYLKPRISYYTR